MGERMLLLIKPLVIRECVTPLSRTPASSP